MTGEAHFRRLENLYLCGAINRDIFPGVQISVKENTSRIWHEPDHRFCHAAGTLHGTVYFKLLDDSAFFAASSAEPEFFLYTVTFQIQLIRPLKPGIIEAIGSIIKSGKQLIIAESKLYDERKRLAAIGSGSFMRSNILLSEV